MRPNKVYYCQIHGIEVAPNTCDMASEISPNSPLYHYIAIEIHARALAAHCECLAMNAENCARSCLGQAIAYHDTDYISVMQKWGLINEKGEPLI